MIDKTPPKVGPSIFIVDDDADLLEELHEFLTSQGFDVAAIGDSRKALARMSHQEAPFVLLTDMHMPGISGLDLANELRRTLGGTTVFKTILFSGAGDMQVALAALRLGVMDFLLKPLELGQLAATTRRALAQIEEESAAQAAGSDIREELKQLAGALAKVTKLAGTMEGGWARSPAEEAPSARLATEKGLQPSLDDTQFLQVIKAEQTLRVRRNKLLPMSASGDPTWEIMLFLLEQKLLGRAVSVTTACHAGSIPATTALRKIDDLVQEQWLERRADPGDKRRVLLDLTELGDERVRAYLTEAVAMQRRRLGSLDAAVV